MASALILKTARASMTGRSHRCRNRRCEDACAETTLRTPEGKIIRRSVVVCDGAGSCPLGWLGAKIASRMAAQWLAENFNLLSENRISPQTAARKLIGCVQRTISKFAGNRGFSSSLRPFSCTLAAAVLNWDGRWITAHIGDGGITALDENGPFILSAPQKGEFANVTYFITDRDAAQNVRIIRNTSPVRSFALFSDGLENLLIRPEESLVAPAMSDILTWLDEAEPQEVTEALHTALEDVFLPRTTDDCTLALLSGNWQTQNAS